MDSPYSTLLRYCIRLACTLCVVVVILLAGSWIRNEWHSWDEAAVELDQLRAFKDDLAVRGSALQRELSARMPNANSGPLVIGAERENLAAELRKLEAQRRNLPIASLVPGSAAFGTRVALNVEIALREQAWTYCDKLHAFVTSLQSVEKQTVDAIALRLRLAAETKEKTSALNELQRSAGYRLQFSFTDASRQQVDLTAALNRLAAEQTTLAATFQAIQNQRGLRKPTLLFSFQEAMRPLDTPIAELQRLLDASMLHRVAQPILDVLPTAGWILLGIVLTPIGIKLFAFYAIAPIAASRPPICLLPDSSGAIEVRRGDGAPPGHPHASAVSQAVVLDADEELLVHPSYVQSIATKGDKRMKWLLDWSMPFTSIAAHLFALERISASGASPIVLSSASDPLSEIAVLHLPAGAAIVLQPRCLVGLVRRAGAPARISRHWRLWHLSAWLTLQLRYVVFHGPQSVIVKGCRGIRVEPADDGRAINQAATLGFSANVEYSTSRCETFGSYLVGAQELFNDRFSGAPGCCIYEETPRAGFRGGIAGRGIEGVLDTMLKVVGI